MRSASLFLLAGLLEIGGGYLVWLWLREHRGWRSTAAARTRGTAPAPRSAWRERW